MSIRQIIDRLLPERPVRRYLAFLSLLFAAAFPLGTYVTHPALKDVAKAFVDMSAPYGEIAGGTLFLLILLNNVFASLLLLLSGTLAGIIPVLSVALNGFLMGLIYRHLSGSEGQGPAALEMLPHALFEIPALLLVASYGLWIGVGTVRRLRGKEAPPIPEMVNLAVARYFTLVFPLLVAAAASETFAALRGG